ncbi:6-carboxytetrahydropterin synthase [Candidatus Bathyarchaeota archaeon]|nr:MAG: 6-carboxytetrahydropterin synthase [Candidatus Bathyarchaeota archaeon]
MEMFAMREFQFSSAASLDVDEKAMQGHNYELRVVVKGTPDERGVILDTRTIERIVNQEIIAKLDKRILNEIIPNPTMERISLWIWKKLKPSMKELCEIRVWENRKKGTSVIYRDSGGTQF